MGCRAQWAWTAAVTEAKTWRDCCRQGSITVSIVSTKRLPPMLWVPKDSFRQMTACRRARSLALLGQFCSRSDLDCVRHIASGGDDHQASCA